MHPVKRLQILLLFVFLVTSLAVPASATLTSSNEKQMYNDANEDYEPPMISQVRSGVEYNVTAFMKYSTTITSSNPQLAFSAYNSNGSSVANTLPKLTGYSAMSDPVMAQNPTTQRIFLVGLATQPTTGSTTALALYTSDDGGFSWYGPTKIYEETATGYSIDKTAIAISTDTQNGSGGYGYIAVMRSDGSTNTPIVLVSASGTTYSSTFYTVATGSANLTDPQVMVNNNGDVYVALVDSGANKIRIASSHAFNVSLFNPMSFTEGASLTPTGRLDSTSYYAPLATGSWVRAASIPVAKLDPVNQRIGVAWHENTTGVPGAPDRIAFAYTPTGTVSWSSPHLITNGSGHDINVGMDVDTNGGFLVSYYSFGASSNDYYPVASYVTISGGTVSHETPIALTSNLSDITVYSSISGHRGLGEYHDVSFSNGTFKTVALILVAQGNPWIWTVTHS